MREFRPGTAVLTTLTAVLWLLPMLASAAGTKGSPDVREVTRTEVLAFSSASDAPLLLDVRSAEEFAGGHIAGAVHIPHAEIRARFAELGQPPREVVVYCRSGRRAGIAAEVLVESGFTVGHLTGDMLGWEEAGLPVTSAVRP
ncbi:MAG: rhodanese-like domain-containing protein [bacterium]